MSMTTKEKEELMLLRMQVAELKKQHDADLKQKQKYIIKIEELEEDKKVLALSVRAADEKIKIQNYITFGAANEKFRTLFGISKEVSDAINSVKKISPAKATNLFKEVTKKFKEETDKDTSLDADADVETSIKDEKKFNSSRNTHPDYKDDSNNGGRQIFHKSLKREEIHSKLNSCPNCGGNLTEIGTVSSEFLELKDKALLICKLSRHKYRCDSCSKVYKNKNYKKPIKNEIIEEINPSNLPEKNNSGLYIAPYKNRFLYKCMIGDKFGAAVVVDKYFSGIPFTRVAKRLSYTGVKMSATNLTNYQYKIADGLQGFEKQIHEEIKKARAINLDETRLKVHLEKNRKDETNSWIWVMVSADPKIPAVYFHYDPYRNGTIFDDLRGKNYKGFIQTDAFSVYTTKCREFKHTTALCFAHSRRRFARALESGNYKINSSGFETLEYVLDSIGNVCHIDKKYRKEFDSGKLNEEKFNKLRKEETMPVLLALDAYLEQRKHLHVMDSSIYSAIKYYENQKDDLKKYLDCAFLGPTNNAAERAVLDIIAWRNSSRFAGSPRGAKAGITISTLIHTANINNLDPTKYLLYLMNVVVEHQNKGKEIDYAKHMAWRLSKETIKQLQPVPISIMPKTKR